MATARTPDDEPGEPPQREELPWHLLAQGVLDYAIFMLDPQGYILSWNAGAQRIKGYSADEIIGRHFSTFYPPDVV
ncbi:PAS domain S-box protein, partial [Micromonospora sp. NPDC049679]|uniref:PAS domain S-box protein n=1 Tax=Micromonospora sp. NPDC049679 TaxID=3155920 RepID=UPI0033DE6992